MKGNIAGVATTPGSAKSERTRPRRAAKIVRQAQRNFRVAMVSSGIPIRLGPTGDMIRFSMPWKLPPAPAVIVTPRHLTSLW